MMDFDMTNDRRFYETMADKYPMLKNVIDGDTTLTDGLDRVISTIEDAARCDPIARKKPQIVADALQRFQEYFGILVELNSGMEAGNRTEISEVLQEYQTWTGGDMRKWYNKMKWGTLISGGISLLGGIALNLIGLLAIGAPLCFGGLAELTVSIAAEGRYRGQTQRTWRNLKEQFGPIYELAEQLDKCIDRAFICDRFHDDQACFERTYAALTADERAPVNDYLFRLLGVGGMPGMDEIQLKSYLSGLLKPEGGG